VPVPACLAVRSHWSSAIQSWLACSVAIDVYSLVLNANRESQARPSAASGSQAGTYWRNGAYNADGERAAPPQFTLMNGHWAIIIQSSSTDNEASGTVWSWTVLSQLVLLRSRSVPSIHWKPLQLQPERERQKNAVEEPGDEDIVVAVGHICSRSKGGGVWGARSPRLRQHGTARIVVARAERGYSWGLGEKSTWKWSTNEVDGFYFETEHSLIFFTLLRGTMPSVTIGKSKRG